MTTTPANIQILSTPERPSADQALEAFDKLSLREQADLHPFISGLALGLLRAVAVGADPELACKALANEVHLVSTKGEEPQRDGHFELVREGRWG